jgi:hypothetical protein
MDEPQNIGHAAAANYRKALAQGRQKMQGARQMTTAGGVVNDPAFFSLADVAQSLNAEKDYGTGVRWEMPSAFVSDDTRKWWAEQLFKAPDAAGVVAKRNTPLTRCLSFAQLRIAEAFACGTYASHLYFCGVFDLAPEGARSSEVILPVWRIFACLPHEQLYRWETFAYAYDGRNLFVW